jgi:DMSO/TMAO reductase YedYZ molybdopterin-dependent catalytic subunit
MNTKPPQRARQHQRAGFLAGLIAGGIFTLLMVTLARTLNLFSVPELVGYRIIAAMPLVLFSAGVETFGGNAKQLLLIGTTIGQVVVGGFLGLLWASYADTLPGESRPNRRLPAVWQPSYFGGIVYAAILFVVIEVGIFTLAGAGLFGALLPAGVAPTVVAGLIEVLTYGLTLSFLYRALMVPATEEAATATGAMPLTRRQLLVRFVFGIAALAVGGSAILGLLRTPVSNARAKTGGRVGDGDLPPEITPTEDFYHVSKNFSDPKVAEDGWKVEIGGLVDKPYSLTLAEIRTLPAVTETRTLCCISNEIGGDLISNATWKGVRLRDILDRAGVQAGAIKLVLGASDGYTDSIAIDKALNGDVIAVYEMNGAPLPDDHGFPLRLLVPDIYGMKNVKWLTRISAVADDYKGFWQQQGWSDPAQIKTMSRIDFPVNHDLLPTGPTRMGGVAFAGARGIAKIELSVDGGKSWQDGTIRKPLGPYTWVLWTATPQLAEGDHRVMVRATDGTGKTQTEVARPPLPDGATGWHTISVRAANGVTPPSGRRGTTDQGGGVPQLGNGAYGP